MNRTPPARAAVAFGAGVALLLAALCGWWLLGDDSGSTQKPGPSINAAGSTAADAERPPSGPSTAVDLPTTDWRPGDGGDQARITGTLIADRNNCVVLGHRGGKTAYAAWPAGYTALIGTDGVVRLRDAEGTVVAESGDAVTMGGGYSDVRTDHPCLPKKGKVAVVQSTVTVTARAEHWLPRDAEPTGAPGDRAYLAWRERTPFRSCGEQFLAPFLDGAALAYADCLRDAVRERRTAEATVTFTTVEGDPITHYLRVRKDGSVEVFTDSTQDHFGSGAWERRTCRKLEPALHLDC